MHLAAPIAHLSCEITIDEIDNVRGRSGESAMYYKLPLVFEPQPEGGFTVTSPLLPELITEGDTVEDALENVRDALAAVIEVYQETGKTLPPNLLITDPNGPVWAETVVAIP
jgi:antitoxin HicB